ncbi:MULTISPECIES: DUF2795 domain-containing protein [unclassified Streptomyces]|uniref:DUF2795 domain-containing protein n=1 Tax=unclassified Streptomyces TaxID=2593676 RepID=UPI0036FE4D43
MAPNLPPVGAEVPFTLGDLLAALNITWPCSKKELLEKVQQGPDRKWDLVDRSAMLPLLSKIPDREYQDGADVEREYQNAIQKDIGKGPYATD